MMQKIVRVRVNLFGRIYEEFKEIGETQRKIIDCFGSALPIEYNFGRVLSADRRFNERLYQGEIDAF